MKKTFKPALFVLLLCGVFGADEDKVKVVMEGDSVTLNSDLTQIQKFNEIEWRFKDNNQPIAYTVGNKPKYSEDERFRNRLKLNQTGYLTITNMKTKHSGVYHLLIDLNSGPLNVNFTVTVYESPSVIDAVKGEINFESVKEGDPVTLQTDVTQLSGDELIVWRCGEEGKLIAKADIEAKSSPLYDTEERFRGRLELDQTGSLIITNTRTTDSGFYTVKISSKEQTVYKRFTVTVSEPGLSPGAVAGIGVAVLVLVAAAAAAAVGVIYYRRKISELRKQILTVSVTEGYPVILKHDKEIKKDDEIQWLFGEGKQRTSIAEIIGKTGEIVTHDDAADGRFRDRLKLDKTTGSLIIKNSRTTHSGLYTLRIISSSGASLQTFILTVNAVTETLEEISVEVGDSVTLNPVTLKPDTGIQRDDEIIWMFGDQDHPIAVIRGGTVETYDAAGEIFRDKLKLNKTTGSLTITDITAQHTRPFKLQIISSRGIFFKTFWVVMTLKVPETVTVREGDPVTLKHDKEIKKDDEIQWLFGEGKQRTSIAEISGKTGQIVTHDDAAAGRFRGRLDLDKTTGSLIIKNSRTAHSGLYTLHIISSSGASQQTFILTVNETLEEISVEEGDSVTLNPDTLKPDTTIQRNDQMLWMFGDQDHPIAVISRGTVETYNAAGEIFRDKLKLNKTTGSLTITDITARHTGLYSLQIISSRGTFFKKFRVFMSFECKVTAGESVHLSTDRPTIERDDVIEWRFGEENSLIAEIKGGAKEIYDVPDKIFRDTLELEKRTGDLTIKNFTAEHAGHYKLKIRSSKGDTNKTYSVTIRVRPVTAGESVHLSTDRPTIERDDVIEWRFGEENSLIAEIKGGAKEIHDVPDKRFRDTLELDDQTGDLTIKNSTDQHAGDYKLKIHSSEADTNMTYDVTRVKVPETVTVREGDPVTLKHDKEIKKDDEIQWLFGGGEQQTRIAKFIGKTGQIVTHDAAGRFRGRLKLDKKTGSLTIKNSRTADSGLYTLHIISSSGASRQRFILTVNVRHVPMTVGDPVHLSTGLPKIQRDDVIQWMFGDDSLIAEIKGWNGETYDGPDKRFRDRLKLNDHTGDLTIKNSTAEHAGDYNLKIRSSEGDTNRTYIVTRDDVREKSQMKEKNDSSGKRVNESVSVEMQPLMNKQVPDGVNESASVEMRPLLDK